MTDFIVSLTSHGSRIFKCARTIFSIIRNTVPTKIVLTVYEKDLAYVHQSEDLVTLIDNGVVDLIVAPLDLGPHLKYYYAMEKYKDSIVITVDDDILYDERMVETLLRYHRQYPSCVISNRCHHINSLNYNYWEKCISKQKSSHYNFATGVGGVLYFPGCFESSKYNCDEILKVKYADDIYLKVLELRNGVEVFNANNLKYLAFRDRVIERSALYKSNVTHNRNNVYLQLFKDDFGGVLH